MHFYTITLENVKAGSIKLLLHLPLELNSNILDKSLPVAVSILYWTWNVNAAIERKKSNFNFFFTLKDSECFFHHIENVFLCILIDQADKVLQAYKRNNKNL